jgi:hypothetical protein
MVKKIARMPRSIYPHTERLFRSSALGHETYPGKCATKAQRRRTGSRASRNLEQCADERLR